MLKTLHVKTSGWLNKLDAGPDVPESKWFRRFPGFFVCGEGEFIKTFLLPGQLPDGDEIQ